MIGRLLLPGSKQHLPGGACLSATHCKHMRMRQLKADNCMRHSLAVCLYRRLIVDAAGMHALLVYSNARLDPKSVLIWSIPLHRSAKLADAHMSAVPSTAVLQTYFGSKGLYMNH